MKKFFLPLVALALVVSVSSCKKETKEEEPTPTPAPAAPGNPMVTPSDADAVLVGIKTVTFVSPGMGFPEIEQPLGTAVAVFPNNRNFASYIDAGTVKCNANALAKQSNNSYVYTPGISNPTGLDFGSAEWSVSGTASVPAIEQSFGEFPETPKFSAATVSTGAAFTLSLTNGSLDNADSVYVQLISTNGNVIKTFAGNTSQFGFTAEEMGKLAKGDGYVQVAPYASLRKTVNGTKNVYLINETVVTKTTKFQ